MIAIHDPRVTQVGSTFHVQCPCGRAQEYNHKNSARMAAERGTCRACRKDYRVRRESNVYRNAEGKWCSSCNSCGVEQAYTRRDHAVSSDRVGWMCKTCSAPLTRRNWGVGSQKRLFNRFRKSAAARGLEWAITEKEMFQNYTAKCTYTGWDISVEGEKPTASLDRIDNSCGYTPNNIQWVHTSVNMARGALTTDAFINMCTAVADREKW